MRDYVDYHNSSESREFQAYDENVNFGHSQEEYVQALLHLEEQISIKQRAMLKAHAESPFQDMSVFELAAAIGASTAQVTYSLYGRLGHLLADVLEPTREASATSTIWTRYIGEGYRSSGDDLVRWQMHSKLVEALSQLGWAHPTNDVNITHDIELAQNL